MFRGVFCKSQMDTYIFLYRRNCQVIKIFFGCSGKLTDIGKVVVIINYDFYIKFYRLKKLFVLVGINIEFLVLFVRYFNLNGFSVQEVVV